MFVIEEGLSTISIDQNGKVTTNEYFLNVLLGNLFLKKVETRVKLSLILYRETADFWKCLL